MMSELKKMDQAYVAGTYARFPVEIVSGKGSIVKDETGKEYIDMDSGIGVTAFGIADDVWQQAVIDQLGKVSIPPTCITPSPAHSWPRCCARKRE